MQMNPRHWSETLSQDARLSLRLMRRSPTRRGARRPPAIRVRFVRRGTRRSTQRRISHAELFSRVGRARGTRRGVHRARWHSLSVTDTRPRRRGGCACTPL